MLQGRCNFFYFNCQYSFSCCSSESCGVADPKISLCTRSARSCCLYASTPAYHPLASVNNIIHPVNGFMINAAFCAQAEKLEIGGIVYLNPSVATDEHEKNASSGVCMPVMTICEV